MFAVGEKAEWRLQEGSGSAAFPPRAGAPRPPLSAAPPPGPRGGPRVTFLADAGAVDGRAGDGVLAGAARGAVDAVSVRRAEESAVRALTAGAGLRVRAAARAAARPPAPPRARGAPHRVAGRAPAEAAVGLARAAVQAEAVLLAAGPVRVGRAGLVAVEAGPARPARALAAHRVAAAGEAGAGREARRSSEGAPLPVPGPPSFPFRDISPTPGRAPAAFRDSGGFSTEGLSHWAPEPLTRVPRPT